MKYLITLFFLIQSSSVFASCEDWISNLNIKKSKNCEEKCRVAPTDMSSYMCPRTCKELCSQNDPEPQLNIYGLTDDELSFCKKNIKTCLKAYKLTWDAENLCRSMYDGRSETNDETDACRHYVWATMLARDIGVEDAETILNAHENNPFEPEDEKAMDLANNRLALVDFLKNKSKKYDDKSILDSFLSNLKKKKIIVISPRVEMLKGKP